MNGLMESFGDSIDWIAVVIIAIFFTVIFVFLIAFFVGMAKASKQKKQIEEESKEPVRIKRDKIQKMLDTQNKKIGKIRKYCKKCGARIIKLSGKCIRCGTMNDDLDDEDE